MKRAFPSLLLFSGVELIFLATFAVIGWAGISGGPAVQSAAIAFASVHGR